MMKSNAIKPIYGIDLPFYISYKKAKPNTEAPIPVLTLSTTVERNTQPAIHKYFLFLVTKYIIKKTENKIAKSLLVKHTK